MGKAGIKLTHLWNLNGVRLRSRVIRSLRNCLKLNPELPILTSICHPITIPRATAFWEEGSRGTRVFGLRFHKWFCSMRLGSIFHQFIFFSHYCNNLLCTGTRQMILNMEVWLSGLSSVKNSPVASFTGYFWRLYCLVSVFIRKERLFIYIVMIVYGETTLLLCH